jgi:hypothetical protein
MIFDLCINRAIGDGTFCDDEAPVSAPTGGDSGD